jgi:uncharacterized protein YjbI with pentapeptide repeats
MTNITPAMVLDWLRDNDRAAIETAGVDLVTYFEGRELKRHDFSALNLNQPTMSFERADLRQADFSLTLLHSADFSSADLRGANFAGANLVHAGFRAGDRLGEDGLDGARFDGAELGLASLTGLRLTTCGWVGAQFSGCRISVCSLASLNMTGVSLAGVQLQDCDLTWVVARDADWRSAKLLSCRMDGLYLPRGNLDSVMWQDGGGADVNLTGATLDNSDCGRLRLPGVNLRGASLRRCILADCNLDGAVLIGADFTGADLGGTQLTNADLTDAVLNDADLTGVDLTGSTVSAEQLATARH